VHIDNQTAGGILLFFLILIIGTGYRKRSRYIRARDKRLTEARHALEWDRNPETRDKPYRRKQFEIDHRVPYSRGGSNKAHNLKLIPKKENRRKGAKMPSLWDRFWDS